MNYLQKNRQNKGNLKKIIIALAVFILGFLVVTFFKSNALLAFSPLWNLRNIAVSKTLDLGNFFKTKNSLIEENKNLKNQILLDQSLALSFRSLEQTNEELLKEIGGFSKETKLSAGVLVRPPQTPYDLLVIDSGANAGINKGSVVALPYGAYIGVVSEVKNKTSEVTLYTSYGIKTEAILERDQLPVTLIGQGGGNFEIKLPRSITIEIGDRVLSAGINPHLLGVVKDINVESTDAFKSVLVSSPQNIFNIRSVNILQ